MSVSSHTRRFALVPALLAGLATTTCREATRPTFPAYSTVTLDEVTGDNIDTPNWWDGVTLLLGADQSVHVLALDMWNNRVRYGGCPSACGEAAQWLHGTGDSIAYSYSAFSAGAVQTSAGIDLVYSASAPGSPGSIRYLHCPGTCNLAGNWSTTPLFANAVSEEWGKGRHNTPLAADGGGGLHLVYLGFQDSVLHYAHCAGACASQGSWQDVALSSGPRPLRESVRLITAAPGGGVHVFYATGADFVHASCASGCGVAGSWGYETVAGAAVAGALHGVSAVFGPDGRLHVAYGDLSSSVTYAVCGAPCPVPGAWSATTLPLATTDVGLAVDGGGALYLATSGQKVTVSRCATSCLSRAGWQSVALDSALGGGQVSIAADAAGRVRVASSYGAWPLVLQFSQSSGP